jgi:hypothetical protein
MISSGDIIEISEDEEEIKQEVVDEDSNKMEDEDVEDGEGDDG